MHVVTDSGMDLTAEQREGLEMRVLPLMLTLDGVTYRSGVDIDPSGFYDILAASENLPTTSLPSPGDFAEVYRELAKDDPDILSVHISSGLSGTYNSARHGATLVPEAHVTCFDTKTLSGAEGWQVEAAARAARAGWPVEQTVALLTRIRELTDTVFTLPTLKYLIHGGRISHIQGLLASVLQIRPQIGVDKETGKYYERGRARTFSRALATLPNLIAQAYAAGTRLRVQVMHANNLEGALALRAALESVFKCEWLPIGAIAPVLGAHTGPGLVGAVFAPADEYPALP